MTINIDTVIAILEAAREAWNAGSIDGVLDKYIDDIVCTTNTGGPNGEILTIRGKENLRQHYRSTMELVDSRSRIQSVRLDNTVVRTRISAVLQHRETGHVISLSLRQILRFQGFRIAEQQDFHDAAKLAAFWRLVGGPMEKAQRQVPV